MQRRLALVFILGLMFFMVSAGADVRSRLRSDLTDDSLSDKSGSRRLIGKTIDSRTYRSPGRIHKIVVPANESHDLKPARNPRKIQVSDYGSFKVVTLDNSTTDDQEAGISWTDEARSLFSGKRSSDGVFIVRDDFNVLFLRSGAIDTTAEDSPGRLIGSGKANTADLALSTREETANPLRLVQFVGPVKQEWLDALRAGGLEPIAYVPSNAYLVRGNTTANLQLLSSAEASHERGEGFIQWEGPFLDDYKIHPLLTSRAQEAPDAEVTVAVQIAGGLGSAASGAEVRAVRALASATLGDPYQVLGFTNLRLRLPASRIKKVAALGGVVNIEPWSAPKMMDEQAAQITAGIVTDDGKNARGPGYFAWLQGKGFGSIFGFSIDISDSGLDQGSMAADKLHPDFLSSFGGSRVSYIHDYTSEQDGSDIPGHGTINASIAAGGTTSAEEGMRDSESYNHGLGIAPFALIGISKIFQSSTRFDLVEPYTKLISEAYRDGARISSNSWGRAINQYDIDSQEYDSRARDAVPGLPGNQEMVICFAAGNAGGGGRIGSPSSGKNVISVAASESSRQNGTDGCLVRNENSDSALDIAFFSSGGKLDDGRLKPDISAPGTHIQGAASQHPEYDGSLVCGEDFGKPYFPSGQTLYTWSSGTSHSTPQIAGAAALVRQFFLNRGIEPSAALVKALLLNSTSYMTGDLAGGDLPHPRQGWGLVNLGRAFDDTPKVFINQSHTFSDSGQEFVMTGEVRDPAQPFRVTLAWTDAPGLSAFASWVNDLDLEVTINGQTYRGNNLKGQESQPGGEPNTKDNVEAVWLPAGTVGTFVVRVKASNVAGDAIPGNDDFTDQDFALVTYNAERKDVSVAILEAITLAGGSDAVADPGENVSMRVGIRNGSPVALQAGRATLTTSNTGVTVNVGSVDFPEIPAGAVREALASFTFGIGQSEACGGTIQFVLDIPAQGSLSRVPFSITTGNSRVLDLFADNLEAGESKWTHASGIKKKKRRVDTWVISTKRFRSGGHSWFTPDLGKVTDAHLDTLPVQLPSDARSLDLVFYHTFEFEGAGFDGGVLEISADGGAFEDLGPKILIGGYNGDIFGFTGNPLTNRSAWVGGRLGELQQVVVDLTSYAGKTVVIRFRIGTDESVKGGGWYIDDVSLGGISVTCTPLP